jgi:hypothetical protein
MGEGSRGDTDDVVEPGSDVEWPDDAPPSPAVPLLPAVAGRLETVHNSVSALGMRIDALGSLTSGVGSAMADRLTEYGDTVSQVTRAQTEALDEYRHGTERTVTELRRSLAASDEVIRRLSARIDELVTDMGSLMEIVRVLGAAPIRTDAASWSSASDEKLDWLRAEVAAIASAIESAPVAPSAPAPASEPAFDPALAADLLRAIDELRTDVKAITSAGVAASLSDAAVSLPVAGGEVAELSAIGEELSGELVALRSEITQLKRRIGMRAKSSGALDDFQLRELADRIAESVRPPVLADADLERIVEAVRPPGLADADIERIVAAVGAHLESTFEVVPEDGELPPPPAEVVDEKPSSRRRR